MKKIIYTDPENVSKVLRKENEKQNKKNEFYNIFAWDQKTTKSGKVKIIIG